jgi:hypothetical protein
MTIPGQLLHPFLLVPDQQPSATIFIRRDYVEVDLAIFRLFCAFCAFLRLCLLCVLSRLSLSVSYLSAYAILTPVSGYALIYWNGFRAVSSYRAKNFSRASDQENQSAPQSPPIEPKGNHSEHFVSLREIFCFSRHAKPGTVHWMGQAPSKVRGRGR